MKREVHYIVLHSTSAPAETIIDVVKNYWTEQRHWKNPGYQYIVGKTGNIEKLLLEKNHKNPMKGYGRNSIHFSFVSEINTDYKVFCNSFMQQMSATCEKIKEIKNKYPNAIVVMQPSLEALNGN